MNGITISKKKLFAWFLVIILLAGIGYGIYSLQRFLPSWEVISQPVAAA